jgi:glutamine synthetase
MSLRFQALKIAQSRRVSRIEDAEKPASEYFGKYVFDSKKRRQYLDAETVLALESAIESKSTIDRQLAGKVAEGLKKWAIDNGTTHYTHWFQPLTGSTAEKHDSFYDKKGEDVIAKFSASSLVQQEPDASSLPSGGLRNTFEARGYTAWDPSSPPFIYKNTSGKTLCIPSVFVSYLGHALDFKTPILKSIRLINDIATKINQKYFDADVKSCTVTLGIEQEYFLVDKALYYARPDLLFCERTLIGHASAKGQQMEDHYFGSIPDRVFNYMCDVEIEALKLGIPLKTRHNEVAPGQFECAPMFEEINLAVDHNRLLMDLMEEIADRHNFKILFHEKPFAGINGSGKHNNWSISTDTGTNLLSPGDNPGENLQFLTFFINTIKAVYDNSDILRASIASAANDHRLGGNEAPPAIISVFIGSNLTKVLGNLGKKSSGHAAADRIIDIEMIPDIVADNTDRNRTSPFAFTGNKFEFRAVGSSKNTAQPMTVLNAAVADQLMKFDEAVSQRITNGENQTDALWVELKNTLKAAKPILFEGNNYSEEWVKEAAKRGLSNIQNTAECLSAYTSDQAKNIFVKNNIFQEDELEARLEILYEEYVKEIQIESRILADLALTQVVPAAVDYLNKLAQNVTMLKNLGIENNDSQTNLIHRINKHINEIKSHAVAMVNERKAANAIDDLLEKSLAYNNNVKVHFENVRYHCDKIERLIDDNIWKLPKYRELLFVR